MTEPHSVPLALADSLAVLLFAAGLFFIARMLARKNEVVGELAYLGFILLAAGGALQALWKLLYIARGINIAWMDNSLFALLAPGFVCLAWALRRGLRGKTDELTAGTVWLAPLFISVLVLGGALVVSMLKWGRAWFFLLAGVAMVGSLLTFWQLARRAQERGLPRLALLFVLGFVVVLVQSGLLRRPEQMTVQPWIEPICKMIMQSAFAFAAWRLNRAERSGTIPRA